jgi:hypothetical protein
VVAIPFKQLFNIFSCETLSNVIYKSAVKHVLEIKYRKLVCEIDTNLSGALL